MKNWRFWLGVAISALFTWLALRGLNLSEFWQDLQGAKYGWLVPGVLVYFGAVWARTWRWHYMLRALKPVPLRTLFPIVTIGYMGNNIYPARAGEVLRCYVLKRDEGISMSASLATVLVERIFDGLVMLMFVFVTLPLVDLPQGIRQLVIVASLAFFGALIVFMGLAMVPNTARRFYTWLVGLILPVRHRQKVLDLADRFMEGLVSLRRGRDVLMIFVTSTVVWLLETVKYWFVMHAFDFEVSFFALMLMNGVVNLATTIPSAPGYVGTFDAPGIETLETFGVDRSVASAYTLVLHAALWLPITLLGAYYFARAGVSWTEVEEKREQTVTGSP